MHPYISGCNSVHAGLQAIQKTYSGGYTTTIHIPALADLSGVQG